MYSFRHSTRDRLRVVQCPSDQIGGWTTDGVGQEYGSGYPKGVLQFKKRLSEDQRPTFRGIIISLAATVDH